MEFSEYVGQPCKSHLAFEFFPKKKTKINLEKAAILLEKKGFFIELKTPIFIGVKSEKTSVSVFSNGKVLVKDIKEKDFAAKLAKKIITVIS